MGRSGGKEKRITTTSKTRASVSTFVPGTPFSEEELSAYARQIIMSSGAAPGDKVFYDLWDDSEKPYVDALIREAEKMGVTVAVIVSEEDPAFQDQVQALVESGAIKIGPEFPDYAYSISEDASGDLFSVEEYDSEFSKGNIRWMNTVIPNQAWADRVYPEISDPEKRLRALGEDFQKFLRIHPESEETWDDHIEKLQKRGRAIAKMQPQEFSFRSNPGSLYPGDPGTDLVVEPIEGARFIPVEIETDKGAKTIVNAPTEEVFFTPKPGSANGRASMSRPYFTGDGDDVVEVTGVVLEYEDGVVVKAYSVLEPEKNALLVRDFIEKGAETGQQYLGEIGLVDPESPIAQTGKTYHTAIIDENNASHGGHGRAWAFSVAPEALAKGVLPPEIADASAHSDLTFGSPDLDITVTGLNGEISNLTKGGHWVGP